jgi:hypothetical protein
MRGEKEQRIRQWIARLRIVRLRGWRHRACRRRGLVAGQCRHRRVHRNPQMAGDAKLRVRGAVVGASVEPAPRGSKPLVSNYEISRTKDS